MNRADPPSCLIPATTASPSGARRPGRTTFAPSFANSSALARPMPEVPPVTNITLLSNNPMARLLLVCRGSQNLLGAGVEVTQVGDVLTLHFHQRQVVGVSGVAHEHRAGIAGGEDPYIRQTLDRITQCVVGLGDDRGIRLRLRGGWYV